MLYIKVTMGDAALILTFLHFPLCDGFVQILRMHRPPMKWCTTGGPCTASWQMLRHASVCVWET